MANDIDIVGKIVHIHSIDSDWNWLTTFPGMHSGLLVQWIRVIPGAANDNVVLKWGVDTADIFFDETIQTDLMPIHVPYLGQRLKPFLDFTAGVYTGNPEIFMLLA